MRRHETREGRADNGMGGQYHSKDTSIGVPHLAHKPEQFVTRLCFEEGRVCRVVGSALEDLRGIAGMNPRSL
jgi:hypothetical protein